MKFLDDLNNSLIGDDKIRKINKEFDESYDIENFDIEPKKKKKNLVFHYVILISMILMLFAKIFILQVVEGKHYRELAEGNRLRTRMVDAPRGLILDKNGKSLVENKPQFVLTLNAQDLPKEKKERDIIAQKVASLLPISKEEILKKMKNYENIFDPIILYENITREESISLKEKLSNIICLEIQEKLNREYARDYGVAHILGYIGKINDAELSENNEYQLSDYLGKAGLELSYENYLKGEKGQERVEVDAQGKVVSVLAKKESNTGNSVVLGMDLNFQKKVYEIMQKYKTESNSRAAAAVTINPQTGEILSSVSLPSYDNNIFTIASKEEFNHAYNNLIQNESKPMINRVIAGLYPPGSTIKPLVASAGLAEGTITPQTTINAPEAILIPNKYNPDIVYRFPDWKKGGHGYVNVYSAVAQSCDVYFYAVGGGWDKIQGLGVEKLKDYFKKYNLGSQTGVDIPGEGSGLVPTPEWKKKVKKEDWYQGDTYHISIGQGNLLVTPLQLVNYIAAVANGGNLMHPHYVSKITDVKGKIIKDQTKNVKKENIISANVIDVVRQAMRQTVTSGTGKSLNNLKVAVAGKTGTAQFENNTSLHSWFVSFAPYDNPQIATVVLFEGGGEGNEVAVPATREILEYYIDNQLNK